MKKKIKPRNIFGDAEGLIFEFQYRSENYGIYNNIENDANIIEKPSRKCRRRMAFRNADVGPDLPMDILGRFSCRKCRYKIRNKKLVEAKV